MPNLTREQIEALAARITTQGVYGDTREEAGVYYSGSQGREWVTIEAVRALAVEVLLLRAALVNARELFYAISVNIQSSDYVARSSDAGVGSIDAALAWPCSRPLKGTDHD